MSLNQARADAARKDMASRCHIADPVARQVAALNVQLGALDAARAQYQGRPTFDNTAFEKGREVVLAKIAKLGGQVAPVAPAIRAPKAVVATNTSGLPAWAQRKAAAMAKAGFTPATLLATVTTPVETTETVELDLTPVAEPTPEPVAEPVADVQQPAKRRAKRNLAAILGE